MTGPWCAPTWRGGSRNETRARLRPLGTLVALMPPHYASGRRARRCVGIGVDEFRPACEATLAASTWQRAVVHDVEPCPRAAGHPKLRVPRLWQPHRLLGHARGARPPRRARDGLTQRIRARAAARDRQDNGGAPVGLHGSRLVQHALPVRHLARGRARALPPNAGANTAGDGGALRGMSTCTRA
jgi:hypothetical protein